jgi:L-arabinose isomerase
MTKLSLPHVGLLALMIDMYREMPEFQQRMEGLALDLLKSLRQHSRVTYSGLCDSRSMVDSAVPEMEKAGAELLLVCPLTYAPSQIVLPAILRSNLPVLIINTQWLRTFKPEMNEMTLEENQALPGIQDLANVLVRQGVSFQVVTGHYRDPAFLQEIKDWSEAAHVARYVRQMRVGLVGYPMDGMGDFALDSTALLGQVGIEVKHIPPGEVAERASQAPSQEIDRQMAADRAEFQVQEPLPEDEHRAASRLEWALRQTVQEHRLDGIAVHFMAVDDDGRFEALPLMAASKLMAEGCGYGGEGDVACAATMAMMIRLSGAAHFFEGWAMDFENESIIFTHMGEGNYRLSHPDRPVRLVRYPWPMKVPKPPVNLVYDFRPGEATVVNLTTTCGGKLKFTVTEGCVLDFTSVRDVPMPQGEFKPDLPLQEFLRRSFETGASHHSALVYGRCADKVIKIASLLGVECERI